MTLVAQKIGEHQKEILDFYQGEVQKEELEKMLHNPEQALNDANILVEDTFKEAVFKGLKEANETFIKYQNQPALWNNHLLLNTTNEEDSDLHFKKYTWGLVLTLSHNATQNAIYGISLAPSIFAALKTVSKTLPIPNVTENIVAAFYSTYLNKSAPIINTIDKGNGIHLTLTWPQIALAAGILFPTPSITAR